MRRVLVFRTVATQGGGVSGGDVSVRVVVVDHRPTTRAVLRQLFETWEWDVVGEAADANEALSLARTANPDLIVADPAGGDPDLANLPTLVEPLGAPAVVSIVDFPHELAASRGRAVLKGVPTEHLRQIFLDALAARAADQEEEPADGSDPAGESAGTTEAPAGAAAPVEAAAEADEVPDAAGADAGGDATRADDTGDAPRTEPSLTSDSVDERRRAARALLAEPATAERAARAGMAVTDPDREVRQLALHALEDNPRLAPSAALEAAAVDPDPGVRARALRLLGRAGHAAHASLLASHTSADFEEPLRRAAVAGLIDLVGRTGSDLDQASLAAVVRAFGLVEQETLEPVAAELGRAAQALGLPRVEAYSSDPRPEVASGAARLIEAAGRAPSAQAQPDPGSRPSAPAERSRPGATRASAPDLSPVAAPPTDAGPPVVSFPPAALQPDVPPPGAEVPLPPATAGGAGTVPSGLEERLGSAEAAVRIAGIRMAAETGALDGALLARVLSDPLTEVRLAAIGVLDTPLSAAPALVLDNVVRSDTSVPVVLAAARALLSAPPAARLQAAEAALAHPSREVRLAGVDLVPADDDGSTVLVGLLADPDPAIVTAAAGALERFPGPEVLVMIWPVLRMLERRTVDLLVDKLIAADRGLTRRLARNAVQSPDPADRALGLRVLVALGADSVGDRLERALGDPARQVRRTALESLSTHPELVSVEAVGPRIHDPDVEVRRLTVEALAVAGDDRALNYLLEAARDPAAEVRVPAREHLLARCLTPSARMLVSALGAPNLRTVAAELLGHAPERTAELIAQVSTEADVETRAAMARVLSAPAAVDVLLASLTSPDPERRRVALRGLALAHQPRSAAAVTICLEDPEADIRGEAARLLGTLGDPAAVVALRRVLVGDPDMEVVRAAEEALRRLTEVQPNDAPSGAERPEPDVDLSETAVANGDLESR
ncbi:MAG TPA: HEAT repeat domain-containing protein [Acidimicrobiales bacterium]|nr:HEAT repeat domain-containing protein [Acidimicrobiales bacterium]